MTPNRTQSAPQLTGLPPQAAAELRQMAQMVYRLQARIDTYDTGIQQSQVVGLTKALESKVPVTRRIMTEAPVLGGRDLRDDMTIRHPGSGGGGTVTSVGLSMPAEFSVAGSPVVAAGTLTVTSDDEPANTVWAGPAAGLDAAPTFRALVSADIPAIVSPLTVAFYINNGTAGDPIAADFAPRAGSLAQCKVLVIASDAGVDLTFDIEQNGVSVFTAPPTVAMGTGALTLVDKTADLTGTIAVAADDIFKLSISSGSASWIVSIKLET